MGIPESIDGVCEVERVASGDAPLRLLIEVPHGATSRAEYEALRARLHGPFPDDLESFFFVNTDVGAPEAARRVANVLAGHERGDGVEPPPVAVILLRSLIPRTFVDCNRVIEDGGPEATTKLTPGLPQYVTDERDGRLLRELHRRYQLAAEEAYEAVCGAGGLALALHTYAPRSVGITTVDDGIVRALRAAYEPEAYARWPRRPTVDVIDETDDGRRPAPVAAVETMLARYANLGVEARRNDTYRLHAGSMGHRFALRYPGRVLCVELDREALADPWVPFEPVRISSAAVARLADPIAAGLARGLAG